MGRPYLVPIGNKRTTIMRFRIVKNDNTEIDSRQIRVTREFIAPPVIENNPGVVVIKDPQTTFNLSGEDKARLDKLQNLVKNVPAESQKELQRYIDQLGDIWYDRADRAETLLQFSRAVDSDTAIPGDLKSRILEQVNLIYTQGEQDAEERVVARKMINDFLAKSTYKKEVFGDGTEENPGLLGQIIDNPEYYEQNKLLVQKIYDEYVKFDTQLSDEAKAVIRDKLTILAGKPPIQKPTTNPEVTVETTSLLTKAKNLLKNLNINNIGQIALWFMIAIVGLFGMIFILRKLAGGKTPPNNTKDSEHDDHGLPTMPENGSHGPDWLHDDGHNTHA